MKHALTVVFIALAANGAYAQPGRGGYIQFHPLLSLMDANHDGVIDEAELAKAPERLRSLDRNSDGRITPEEMSPMGRGGRRGGPEGFEGRGRGERGEGPQNNQDAVEEAVKTYLAFDKNGDGKLTKDEVPERMQGIFERGDANKDGILTADELRAMARAQQPTGGMRGGREGEGRGGFEGRRSGGEGRGRGPGFIDPVFAALDTNHDNAITDEEITNAASALKALDKNGDGKLTEDELRPNFPGRARV